MLVIRCDGGTGEGDDGAVNFFEQQGGTRAGTGRAGRTDTSLAAQHELAACVAGRDSRRQQQVPDRRFSDEQRQVWPGTLAHACAPVAWDGTPTDTSVNHKTQNAPVRRQAAAWRAKGRGGRENRARK